VKQKRLDRFISILAVCGRISSGRKRSDRWPGCKMRTSAELENQARRLGLFRTVLIQSGSRISGRLTTRRRSASYLDFEGTPTCTRSDGCGLPVVATKVGGCRYCPARQTGFLLEPDDLEGLVTALVKLVKNPNSEGMGQCRRSDVEENTAPGFRVSAGLYQLAFATRHSTTRVFRATRSDPAQSPRRGCSRTGLQMFHAMSFCWRLSGR